jgi:His/Glu/Gln/Arg/opine family amino acid ABC transporter permease subunit
VHLDWQFLADPDNIGALLDGLWLTIVLFVTSAAGALLAGAGVTTMRIAGGRALRRVAIVYTDVVRNVPLLVSLFFMYFGLTSVFAPVEFPLLRTPHLGQIVSVVTIALVMGGFVSEIMRQGIEAVPVGQVEAAAATGLSSKGVYRHIVFPQLLPLVLPGLSSEIVNVLKGTTFAMTLGVADLMWQGQRIESETFRGVEIMTLVTAAYFVLSIVTIAAFRYAESLCRIPKAR